LIANISGTAQAIDSGKQSHQLRCFDIRRGQFGKLWSTTKRNDLDLWPWYSIGFMRLSRKKTSPIWVYRFMTSNFSGFRAVVKVHGAATFHETALSR